MKTILNAGFLQKIARCMCVASEIMGNNTYRQTQLTKTRNKQAQRINLDHVTYLSNCLTFVHIPRGNSTYNLRLFAFSSVLIDN